MVSSISSATTCSTKAQDKIMDLIMRDVYVIYQGRAYTMGVIRHWRAVEWMQRYLTPRDDA